MAYAKTIDGYVATRSTQPDDSWTEVTSLPEDKVFRNAFTLVGGAVVEDLTIAKEIAHEERRAKRDADLAPLDRQYTYAPEVAEPERKKVRDDNALLQAEIDGVATVEDLKGIYHASLA